MRNILSLILATSMTFSSLPYATAQEIQARSPEAVLAELVVNKFFIESNQQKIDAILQQLNIMETDGALEAGTKIELAATATFILAAAGSFFMAYRNRSKDLLKVWGYTLSGIFALIIGGSVGYYGAISTITDILVDRNERNKLKDELVKIRKMWDEQINEFDSNISRLTRNFPDQNIENEVAQVLRKQTQEIAQIRKLREDIVQLRLEVVSETKELGLSGAITGLGTLQTILSVINGRPRDTAMKSLSTFIFGLWTAKNVKDRKKLVTQINEIETQISGIESTIKKRIIEDVPRLLMTQQ